MGTSRNASELASKLLRAADAIPNAKRVGLERAAQLVKKSVATQLPARLRGVGRKGAKIGVRYDIVGGNTIVRATGPEQLIERDTKAHSIMPGRAKALSLAGGEVRAFVAHHPGTKGKHPFEHGVEAAVPLVPEVVFTETAAALRRIF